MVEFAVLLAPELFLMHSLVLLITDLRNAESLCACSSRVEMR